MTDFATSEAPTRSYWISGKLGKVATGLTGLIAVFVALKAMAYSSGDGVGLDDHIFRVVIFAALTVWMTLTMGFRARGTAAMSVLAFACFIELFVIPGRGDSVGTIVSSNLGIVFAYCGLQLYWYRLVENRREKMRLATAD